MTKKRKELLEVLFAPVVVSIWSLAKEPWILFILLAVFLIWAAIATMIKKTPVIKEKKGGESYE